MAVLGDTAANEEDASDEPRLKRPFSWTQLKVSADALPSVYYARFRADREAFIDDDHTCRVGVRPEHGHGSR
ncbi:MAG TPA: hypothetical protein VGX23_15610 [Actinocrinis sp.]|nr:hypothetical protein [Actinocrinis sp.]